MQLTRHTDYALRVLIFLALIHEEERVTMSRIEQHFDIPRNHLIKIVQHLARVGYVDTLRGRSGGLRLARDAAAIKIGDVVRDMETSMQSIDCEHPVCPLRGGCRLKGMLNEAVRAFVDTLNRYTLAEVVAQPRAIEHALNFTPRTTDSREPR